MSDQTELSLTNSADNKQNDQDMSRETSSANQLTSTVDAGRRQLKDCQPQDDWQTKKSKIALDIAAAAGPRQSCSSTSWCSSSLSPDHSISPSSIEADYEKSSIDSISQQQQQQLTTPIELKRGNQFKRTPDNHIKDIRRLKAANIQAAKQVKPVKKANPLIEQVREEQEQEEEEEEDLRMDLSFSGAGFMGCYYFGVVNCFNKYVPRERIRRAAGASAGALSAAYYMLDLPIEPCLKVIMNMLDDIRKRPLGVFDRKHQIVDLLPEALDKMFPEDAHKIVNGRLFVAMTRLKDMKSVIVNEFNSKKDLIDALNCSCFIPLWSGNHVSTFRGVKYIDGGFTNNLPVFDEHTIRICCFAGVSDIAPNDGSPARFLSRHFRGMPFYLTRANLKRGRRALWPPTANYIIDLLERGYSDTKDFILSNDLIQCDKCFGATQPESQPIYSKNGPIISPAMSRASSFMDLGDLQRSNSFRDEASSGDKKMEKQRLKQQKKGAAARQRHLSNDSSSKESDSGLVVVVDDSSSGVQKVSPPTSKRSSFRSVLRNKLHLVAGSGKHSPVGSSSTDDDDASMAARPHLKTPKILVDEAAATDSGVDNMTDTEQRPRSISQVIEDIKATSNSVDSPADKFSSPSASSSSSSSDVDDDEVVAIKMRVYTQNRRQSQQLAADVSPADRFIASRRATQPAIDPGKLTLLLPARFQSTADLLPSCPPSPNLNRHCNECIRMRQEARQDGLDESIRNEANRYRTASELAKLEQPPLELDGKLRSKLKSPLRWFKSQWGARTKYNFVLDDLDDDLREVPLQVGGQPATTTAALETVAY